MPVFLRQREHESSVGVRPTWTERQFEMLCEDLGRRGFGWLDPRRLEQELERLATAREESRAEERSQVREQAKKRARQIKLAPARDILARLGENIGPKVAAVAAGVFVVLLVIWSLTGPGGPVGFNKYFNEIGVAVQGRGLRIERGTVSAYQVAHSVGSQDCAQEPFRDLLNVALHPEALRSPPPDPGVAADGPFRDRYATAVNCVGTLGGPDLTDRILQSVAPDLHTKRVEDLVGVLVRIGAANQPQIVSALGHRAESVRHLAAATMVFGRDDHGAPELLAALESDDRRRVEAASSVFTELLCLGVIEEDEAFEVVRTYCQNIDPMVRRNAVAALALFEYAQPVREVIEVALTDSDPAVVAAARAARETLELAD